MDPTDPYTHSPAPLFKWDPRSPPLPPPLHPSAPRGLADVFNGYGIRYLTVIHIGELGFTPSTLLGMRDEELDDMMTTLSHLFRWELLVGERYGIKAAVRAERRRLDPAFLDDGRRRFSDVPLDAISQEGISEERVHHESGGEVITDKGKRSVTCKKKSNKKDKFKKKKMAATDVAGEGEQETDSDSESDGSGVRYGTERQREHPFIVTEPGEVARAKKNGLDYLFHLYEQCREFLVQVQAMAKEQGDKCPTKVTNQVFRYAKKVGASYINKPKMRHYVHCYALHCLDEETSNALRREYKQRGENVGAWRLACYQPIVVISAQHNWDVDAVFNAHPRLSIWYVPTKLRQLCHLARSHASLNVVGSSNSVSSMF
uniref:Floricaula/leafy-like transcription factor n=1 Tax=Allium cepa TaxID=4679 RepID=J9U9N6_ALLCE|nr:LFY [Allium cepa]